MSRIYFAIQILFFIFASSYAAASSGKIYYVDPQKGSPSADGLSPDMPFKSIQQAADFASAGDIIVAAPGVYLERVIFKTPGKENAPIVLKSSEGPGKTVISAADPAIRRGETEWRLEDKGLQLYSTPFSHCPARVLYSGVDLFHYPTLQSLKEFLLPPDKSPGIEHGCFFDKAEKRLYVRLHAGGKYGSQNPAEHVMSVAPPHAKGFNGNIVERPAESCVFIAPEKDTNIIIDGFTFETPGAAGVLTSGGRVVVRNCCFKGCRFGVFGKGNPPDVFIENCRYDQAFSFEDMVETIEKNRKDYETLQKPRIFWWQRKHFYNRPDLKNYETGLPGGVGKNWHIRDNVIEESFEGMSCWAIGSSENAQIYGNVFRRIIDNAVETENHARNMRVYFNRIENVFEPFSWQPLGGLPWPGPIFIYRNVVYSSPFLNKLWPNWTPGLLKVGVPGSNWSRSEMGASKSQPASKISKRFAMVEYPGFMVFNNTMIFPYGDLFKIVMPVSREFVNFRFFNNIFMYSNLSATKDWNGSLMEFYANINIGQDDALRKTAAGQNGIVVKSPENLKFCDFAKGDLRLNPGSPASGKGITTMAEIDASFDIGALPCGTLRTPGDAAGPGAGISEEKLTPFQKHVRYMPEFVRTPGSYPGLWGIYSPAVPVNIALPVETNHGKDHSLSLIFRLNGENGKVVLVSADGLMNLTIEQSAVSIALKIDVKGKLMTVPIQFRPLCEWRVIKLIWQDSGPLKVLIDEKSATNGNAPVIMPEKLPERTNLEITVHRMPLLDVSLK